MTLSNSVNYNLTANTLIRMAYEGIGIGVEGESLQPEQITVAMRHLNIILKNLPVKGYRLWKREHQSITLVASQRTYTLGQKAAGTTTSTTSNKLVDTGADFVTDVTEGDTAFNTTDSTSTTISAIDSTGILSVASDIFISGENYEITSANIAMPRPEKILECNRKDSDGNKTTVTPLSQEKYENLPNEDEEGTPVQYFYDPTLNNGTLYLWQVPNTTAASDFTIEIVARTQVQDIDSSTDDIDAPQEWYLPLIDTLTYRLAKINGSARLGELKILKDDAREALDDVVDFDQEDASIYIQPDYTRQ